MAAFSPARLLQSVASSPVDERALVARVRGGDRAAFDTLFRTYYGSLCHFVFRYVQSRAEAEDLVHDVFLALWERRAEWEVRTDLPTYLFGAARNRALNTLKRATTERRWQPSVVEMVPHTVLNEAEALLATEEIDAAVRRAVAGLPARCQAALALRWRRQMSYAEIAEAMGIAVKTVEIYMTRGHKALRSAYAELRHLND